MCAVASVPWPALMAHHPALGRSFPWGLRARPQELPRRPMPLTIGFPREPPFHPPWSGGAIALVELGSRLLLLAIVRVERSPTRLVDGKRCPFCLAFRLCRKPVNSADVSGVRRPIPSNLHLRPQHRPARHFTPSPLMRQLSRRTLDRPSLVATD